MRELGEVGLQDAPTMTGIVDRLVKMKLVRRRRAATDRRVVLVEATAEGRELAEAIKQALHREESLKFEAMSDADLDKMEALFDHLLAGALNKMNKMGVVDIDDFKNRLRAFTADPIEFVKSLEVMKDERK
jgi:DNA-binding MarR family transcriptional regulator